MRKVLFFAFAAAIAVVFVACDSKKETKKVGKYELTEQAGKLGLKDSTGHVVLKNTFDEVNDQPDYKAVFAKEGDLSTIVVDGSVIASGIKIDSVDPSDDPDYAYISTAGKKLLWKIGTASTFGPFEDIDLIDGIVFMKSDGLWGAATTDLRGLAPRKYDKVYVVRNGEDIAVLVHTPKGWEMYNDEGVSNGVRYDIAPKKLEQQVKALKIGDDVAVAKVNWKL